MSGSGKNGLGCGDGSIGSESSSRMKVVIWGMKVVI